MKNILNSIKLDIITTIKNRWSLLFILLMPLLAISLNVVMIPMEVTGGAVFCMATTWPSLILFIAIKEEYKKSTLQMNTQTTSTSFWEKNIGNWLFYFMLFFIFCLVWLVYFSIGGWTNILAENWFTIGDSTVGNVMRYNFNLFDLFFTNFIMLAFVYSLLNYSFYLVMSLVLKQKKTFLMVIIIFIIINFIWGGVFNNVIYNNATDSIYYLNHKYPEAITQKLYRYKGGFGSVGIQRYLNITSLVIYPWNWLNQLSLVSFIRPALNIQLHASVLFEGIKYDSVVFDIQYTPYFLIWLNGATNYDKWFLLVATIDPILWFGIFMSISFVLKANKNCN